MKTLLVGLLLVPQAVVLSPGGLGQPPAQQSGPSAARESLRVGYVSVQRITAGWEEAKAQGARFNAAQQEKTLNLRVKQQALEATRQRIAAATDQALLVQLQQQELQQRTELERAAAQAQTEMQALQRQVQTDLQTRIRTVVEALAKAENLQLVLHGDQAVVWTEPGLDLTAAVIERLNASPKP